MVDALGGAEGRGVDDCVDGVISVRVVGVGAPILALVVALSPLLRMTAVAMAQVATTAPANADDRAPALVDRLGRPAQIVVAVLVGEVVGSVCVVNLLVRVIVNTRAIFQCVSDVAHGTDVNGEDWPPCDSLAELGANRYLPDKVPFWAGGWICVRVGTSGVH